MEATMPLSYTKIFIFLLVVVADIAIAIKWGWGVAALIFVMYFFVALMVGIMEGLPRGGR